MKHSVPARLRRTLTPEPARDLLFADALAVTFALFVTYAAWAATKAAYPLSWAGVWPPVRHALPLCVLVVILSSAAVGLYAAGARLARLREHAAAVAYAAALVVVVAAWYGGDSPPLRVVVVGVLAAVAALYGARRLYWRAVAEPPG